MSHEIPAQWQFFFLSVWKRWKGHKKSILLSSEVLNDFAMLCHYKAQEFKGRGVPPVNLLYQTAVNVSVNQPIKTIHFVCFISWLTGLTKLTHTQPKPYYQWKVSFLLIAQRRPFRFCTCSDRPLHNFISSKSFSKTQLDSQCPSTGDRSHVLASCKRYESFISVFTLHSKPTSWKTDVVFTHECVVHINNIMPLMIQSVT